MLVDVSKEKVVFPNHGVHISWPSLDLKLMPGLNPELY